MIKITPDIYLKDAEVKLTFIASPGPGGQNVNKVATGVLLRFNILRSTSLPEDVRNQLMILLGKRVTVLGELIIKATRFRTQERNKKDAMDRLCQFIERAAIKQKKRKKTKPSFSSRQRRLDKKKIHSMKKLSRRKSDD